MQFSRTYKILRPFWWKQYETRTAQPLPVCFNASTQSSDFSPDLFLQEKFLNCVLNNSGFKISCSNNYLYDSLNTEGFLWFTQQWSFQHCCHRALIKIQASYLSFSSSTGKPLNNEGKHEQEEGTVPNALSWSPLPRKWLFGLCVLSLLALCSFHF